eukprot:6033077-Amphidinium_carterae.1
MAAFFQAAKKPKSVQKHDKHGLNPCVVVWDSLCDDKREGGEVLVVFDIPLSWQGTLQRILCDAYHAPVLNAALRFILAGPIRALPAYAE